ncbi:MAG TPA: 4Fe-4S dicluster domain-containing protein [Anaerolineales bacterium]|nr:4Fe-4S dicluster domain-containing protein [Anaerolineales bacterium]
MNKRNISRRDFLKLTALGAAIAAGMRTIKHTSASGEAPKGKHQWAMVIDQSKCTGCNYCTLACQANNDINPAIQWNKVLEVGTVGEKKVFLPRPCMHCKKAPCVEVCPVGASYYRDDGIVMMDYDKCIGCRYCQVACPYEARSFNWEKFTGENPAVPQWGTPTVERRPRGVPEKCSFCYQIIDRGLALGLTPGVDENATPACVVACPTGARIFGDLNDPESNVSKVLRNHPSYRLREDLGTEPRVYYIPAVPEKEA